MFGLGVHSEMSKFLKQILVVRYLNYVYEYFVIIFLRKIEALCDI